MALDIEQLHEALSVFANADAATHARYRVAEAQTTEQLAVALPALADDDRAAVAYYIAGLLSALRQVPLNRASDVVVDTAIGYTLTAAKLLGIDA